MRNSPAVKHFDMIGKKYNRLTIVAEEERASIGVTKKTERQFLCQCECGKQVRVLLSNLLKGNTNSCGCWKREKTSKAKGIHKLSKHPLHVAWANMKSRCYSKNHSSYNTYGARGIIVEDIWKNNFLNFYTWAINNGWKTNLTIERIDVNKNYCPENCTWIEAQLQAKNRTTSRYLEYKGERLILCDMARRHGLKPSVLLARLNFLKWDLERALTQPIRNIKK